VVLGYGLASAARPLIGLATVWPAVLGLRFTDRVGKGLRTSPRDALIADATPPGLRGAAYGLHRAMDHAGAVLGPLAAAALLAVPGIGLRHVFLLAAVPGAAVVLVLLLAVKETERGSAHKTASTSKTLGPAARALRPFLIAVGVFTLGNSTDAFLLLRLGDAGISAPWIAILWAALHTVKLTASAVGGRLSDRHGRRSLMLAGWAVYAAVYAAFAMVETPARFVVAFLVYGLYFGLTEPVEKAWVADLVPETVRGTAFGLYHATVGLAALPASVLFGLLWKAFGAPTAFATGAVLAALAALLLLRVPTPSTRGVTEAQPS